MTELHDKWYEKDQDISTDDEEEVVHLTRLGAATYKDADLLSNLPEGTLTYSR